MISPRRSLSHLLPPLGPASKLDHLHTMYSNTDINRIIELILLLDNNHYYYPGPPRSKYCSQTLPANSICARKHTWMTWPFRIFQVLSYRKSFFFFSVVFPPNLCVKESTFSISHVGLSRSLRRDCPNTRSELSTCTCYILQFPPQPNSSKQNRKHNPRKKPGIVNNKTVTTSNIL